MGCVCVCVCVLEVKLESRALVGVQGFRAHYSEFRIVT